MIEIRFHGRGGQGAVTTAELLAQASIAEGRWAQAFPSFGPERRGAPVLAFCRVSDQRIFNRNQILTPDIVVVLDSSLMEVANPLQGLKPQGVLVVNSELSPQELKQKYNFPGKVVTVDATKIAKEVLGLPITNTAMLGALLRATEIIKIESLEEPFKQRFSKNAEINLQACQRAYQETRQEG